MFQAMISSSRVPVQERFTEAVHGTLTALAEMDLEASAYTVKSAAQICLNVREQAPERFPSLSYLVKVEGSNYSNNHQHNLQP